MNCFFIFLFKNWLGPFGIFSTSLTLFIVSIFFLFLNLCYLNSFGFFFFVDFGRWFFILDIIDSNFIFIVDNLSILVSLLVLFLSIFAQYFGSEYMYREAFIIRLLYLLNMFITSVIFLFFVFDFFLILIIWELIGLFSLFLVNFYSTRVYTLKAALKTFIFSRLSDLCIFLVYLFFILIFFTTDFSIIFLKVPFFSFYNLYIYVWGLNLLNLLALLIVCSGLIKAAQFFFHTWLPDAMEAPTPASALIHSSTLVIMGIYFIIRFSIIFEFSFFSNYFLSIIGAITIAFGSISASFQNDIKKLVAYSTISQMGYLFCGCGFLCYNEVIFYLAIHALNKAFLFILVGYIVHFFNGNTDLRFMGSFYFYSLDLAFILIIISLNLTGLPFTSGFIAKEFLIFQTFRDVFILFFVRFCWLVSFIFTPLYMLLLNLLVMFYSKSAPALLYSSTSNFFFKQFFYKKIYSELDFSFVFSKLTAFLLFFFYCYINLFGEFFLFIHFNILTLNNSLLFTFLTNQSVSLFSLHFLSTTFLLYYLNWIIAVLFFFSLHSLFKFFIY